MSLHRLALRLAAVEALNPSATVASGPWPTIAGGRVFDSRQAALDELTDFEVRPVLVVYTEEESSDAYAGAPYNADEHMVDLVVEAIMAVKGSVEIEQADGGMVTVGTVDTPVSDPQHEALLDWLEAGVRRAFDRTLVPAASALLYRVGMEVRSITSAPLRTEGKSVRLAARTVTFKMKVQGDDWRKVNARGVPWPLSIVDDGLQVGYARAILDAVAATLPPADPQPQPLDAVVMYVGVDRLPADADDADLIASQPPLPAPPGQAGRLDFEDADNSGAIVLLARRRRL